LETGRQALEWICKGVELFETSGFQHAYGEFWQEDQRMFRVETDQRRFSPIYRYCASTE
jgi:hypothetical protein